MITTDYPYYFQHANNAQWLLDMQPIIDVLKTQKIHNPVEFEQAFRADPAIATHLRKFFHVHDANQAALSLYQCTDVADFTAVIQRYASHEHIKHLAIAILSLSEEASHYIYQIAMPLFGENRTFLVHCLLPSLADAKKGLVVSITDVSLLADAEHDLEERERFVNAMLKAMPDIFMVYDFNSQKTLFQNIDLVEQLGYSAEDMAQTNNQLISYVIHPDDQLGKTAMQDIYATLAKGKVYEVTIRLQHYSGDWRHYSFRSAALERDEKGRLRSAIVLARDITEVLKTQQILSAQQRRYQLLADNFSDVIILTDSQLAIKYISPSLSQLLGYEVEAFAKNKQALDLLGLASEKQRLHDYLEQAPVRSEGNDLEETLELNAQTKNKRFIPVELSLSLLRDEFGLVEGLLIIVRDISDRLAREAENRLAAKVFSNSLEGIYITNDQGIITQVNQAFYTITGFTPEFVLGKKPAQLSSGWHDITFRRDILPMLKKNGSWSGEIMSRRANGEAFLTWMSISEVRDSREKLIGIITSFRDITEAKNSEENIRKLAYYDPLTDLPNRQLFSDRLHQTLQRASRNRHYSALLFLDLDGFKDVNDVHGHATGDRLLTMVAERLKLCVRGEDTVARMGGDEFTILLGALSNKEAAENAAAQVAQKAIKRINDEFIIQDKAIHIGTSIGIALYPDDSNQDLQLIKLADTAMYHAKSAGKNNYQFYTQDMHERLQKRLKMEKDILKGIKEEQFLLAYLPKFDLNTQQLVSCEALLRWQHPEQGLLAPASFLHTLAEMGLGDSMGEWVIKQAFEQMQNMPGLHVSINLFAKQYHNGELVKFLKAQLKRFAVKADRLTLEIPEHLIMDDTGYAFALISDLKALGFRVSIDDFASGMLSISYLSRLPIDEVKISRQFIESIDKSEQQLQLVGSIIALAKSLDLCITAEGVERPQQLNLLNAAHCQRAQGYLFSKPLFIDQLSAYIHELNHK